MQARDKDMIIIRREKEHPSDTDYLYLSLCTRPRGGQLGNMQGESSKKVEILMSITAKPRVAAGILSLGKAIFCRTAWRMIAPYGPWAV